MLPYTETYLFTNIYMVPSYQLILSITYKYVNSIFISESYQYLKLNNSSNYYMYVSITMNP